MQLVEKATLFHAQCAITKSNQGPMIDTMLDFDLDHQGRFYISVQKAKEMGALIGLMDREDAEAQILAAQQVAAEAQARAEALQEQVDAAARFIESLDVIESAGFRARKKAGRPPNRDKQEVA